MKIFDGYNVIGAGRELGLDLGQNDKEERLLRLLFTYRSRRRMKERFVVIFDGDYGRLADGPRRSTRGGITVEWAVGESADDLIVRRVRKAAKPRGVQVITSDRDVLDRVRRCRAEGVRSGVFLRGVREELKDDERVAEKPEAPSPEEVQEWLTLFGEEGEKDRDEGR
jgi:predicted RNA-binding protein with PIN domain